MRHRQTPGRHGFIILAAAVQLLAAGCAAKPPFLSPTEVNGTLQASADLNPSVSRRPSPLLVRVYELKTAAAFENADFVSLYQRDQAELGAEMVGRDEYVLNPGDARAFSKVCGPDTRFLGVLGAYRELDRARWRSVVPIEANRTQRVLVQADALAITATTTVVKPR